MAKLTTEVIHALRETARQLANNRNYRGDKLHSGNCELLMQQIWRIQKSEIHIQHTEQVVPDLIQEMLNYGFDLDDLRHFETLSDKLILEALPPAHRNLKHYVKADVILYLQMWADLIESKWLDHIYLPMNLETKESIL